MYESFFELREPFCSLSPDPRCLRLPDAKLQIILMRPPELRDGLAAARLRRQRAAVEHHVETLCRDEPKEMGAARWPQLDETVATQR